MQESPWFRPSAALPRVTADRSSRSPGSGFVPIYGRRRLGKSELILRFLRGKAGIYFLGKQVPAGLQMREFLQESAVALGQPLLAELTPES